MTKYVSPVDYSIAGEKATGLGISGRRLQAALDALRAHDAGRETGAPADPVLREKLVLEAAEACWGYIVQRELLGLGTEDAAYVLEAYRVPDEVRRRLGPKSRRH
jgi:hypothetical protein